MWEPNKYHIFQLNTWNIVIIYLVLGFLWILFSDRLLEQLIDDPATLTQFQTTKGWFYVLITALLLYILISRYISWITRMRSEYTEQFDLYRTLLEQGNQVVIQVDDNQRFSYTNAAVRDILGYEDAELKHMGDFEIIVHPDDMTRFHDLRMPYKMDNRDHDPVKKQVRLRHKNGTWRWYMMILTDKRSFEHIESRLLLVRDIHEETTLYEQLRVSQARFKHLFQEAPVGYHSLGSDLKFIDINNAELNMIGYERDEIIGKKSWADVIVPEDYPTFEKHKKELMKKGSVKNQMYTVVRKDGTRRSVILNGKAFFDDNGRLLYTFGNVLDLTEKLQAEKELNEAHSRLTYHIQNTPLGFVEWDAKMRVMEWSRQSEQMFGWKKEEVVGKLSDEWSLVYSEDAEYVMGRMEKMLEGKELRNVISNRNLTRNGDVRYCEWYNSALLDKNGNLVSVMSLVHDVTERVSAHQEIRKLNVLLEEKVRQRTRELELANKELESFAYSVSHDLRAPLRGIDGFSQVLLEKHASQLDDRGVNYLNRVRQASQRMGFLIDDILGLSRISRTEIKMEQVDLAALSREIITSLSEKEPERKVDFRSPDKLMVTGDASLLRVVMQNLLDNAWKYSSPRDLAVIEIGIHEYGGDMDTNGNITVFVRDNGVGFKMKYHDKLFMAFQRLHSQDEFPGTGIGLATVQRIVQRHSGTIRAESNENEDAVFFFNLPNKSVK